MKIHLLLLFVLFSVLAVHAQRSGDGIGVIPRPASVQLIDDQFELTDESRIIADLSIPAVADAAQELVTRLRRPTGFPLSVISPQESDDGDLVLRLVPANGRSEEWYSLLVDDDNVILEGGGRAGLFYGIETLLQLFPPDIYASGRIAREEWEAQCARIEDSPRFGWRGMHLDVSRHFFPKEFIYTYIDMLAMHKFNTFHWHLVDDQGWRIEIKKWPRLTEIGAWRVDREDKHWNAREPQGEGDSATYGGFYTQEEIRDIVAYAASKNITVVPEIEMPAHVTCVLAAYPQFSCTGGPFTVPPGSVWPITDIYCAGNDSTFLFLEDVLTEVMDLFPGTYIHIGGDEATKTEWEKCPKCQARIEAEGLENEEELQSYFIRRMEKFIVSKGRRLIGWDEILEGGLAPEATVMSWRGIAGGIAAARAGHDAVMSPTSHCYFDYYQGRSGQEPLAIGGYLPLSKVYEFDPVPDSLTADGAKHILGGQANLWTEFIPTPEHAQYMTLPRMAAMAEAVWSQKEGRSWDNFAGRIEPLLRRYEARGYNYARSVYTVDPVVAYDAAAQKLTVSLSSEIGMGDIRYTLDGTEPTPTSASYDGPIGIQRTATVRAAAFTGPDRLSITSAQPVFVHTALGRPVQYATVPTRYNGGGMYGLVDGVRGGYLHADGRWQGVSGRDLEATIDLGENKPVRTIASTHLQNTYSWIFFPARVEFFAGADTTNMVRVAVFERPIADAHDGPAILEFRQQFRNLSARYVRVKATNVGVCPEWHLGAGQPTWVFVDEVVVE